MLALNLSVCGLKTAYAQRLKILITATCEEKIITHSVDKTKNRLKGKLTIELKIIINQSMNSLQKETHFVRNSKIKNSFADPSLMAIALNYVSGKLAEFKPKKA